MVNRRSIARGAALLLCAVLAQGQTAAAEEKRLGDYIYVPAMQASSAAGAISLRVEGLTLDAGSDEAQVVDDELLPRFLDPFTRAEKVFPLLRAGERRREILRRADAERDVEQSRDDR